MPYSRPSDDRYWVRPWSRLLFAGDLFVTIPFLEQPGETQVDEWGDGKHFLGPVAFGYGLLISPTCDMVNQKTLQVAHPYRLFVPVLPLAEVAEAAGISPDNIELIRNRDQLQPYMYLPALPSVRPESVACLFRASLQDDAALRETPRRIAQLAPEARKQLKIKLSRYFGRFDPDPDEVHGKERDEEKFAADAANPSPYDLDPEQSPEDIPDWDATA